jgi:hypothetical protein
MLNSIITHICNQYFNNSSFDYNKFKNIANIIEKNHMYDIKLKYFTKLGLIFCNK